MKIVFSYLLVLTVLTSIVGYFPFFKMEQWAIQSRIKKEIKEGIPEDKLHIIEFKSAADIHWTKEKKEFKIGDRFYDIVHIDSINKLKFACVNDVEESLLFANLNELVSRRLNDHHPIQKVSKVLLQLTYFFEPIDISPVQENGYAADQASGAYSYQNDYSGINLRIPSPPPQA